METLAAASVVVLLGLSGIYFFLYRLHKKPFFAVMGLAWLFNLIYVLIEAIGLSLGRSIDQSFAEKLVSYVASLPSTYLVYIARFNLGSSRLNIPLRQLMIWSFSIVAFIVAALSFEGLSDFERFMVLFAPGLSFTIISLFLLGLSLRRKSNGEILDIIGAFTSIAPPPIAAVPLGGESNSPSFLDEIPETTQRPISLGRTLCAYSLMAYGLMQVLYFFKDFPWFIALFWFALILKACNGAGVAFLVLADFRAVGEAYRLQSLAAELGALTASVEHDIRNPISTMNKTLANLRRKFQHEPAIQKGVHSLEAQISRINSAVDVIPQLRESDSYYRKRFKRWDLVEIAHSAVKFVKENYRGILQFRIEITSSHPEIPVSAYRERLLQAVVNIITNSIEAYEMAGRDSSALVSLHASLDRTKGVACLSIRDEAGGIPADIITMITRPMFSTKTDNKVNRGIGLYTAERFINHHRGRILLDTDHVTFTKITIEMPAYSTGER